MKIMIMILLSLTICFAGFNVSHSEYSYGNDLTQSSSMSGKIKGNYSEIDVKASRYLTPKTQDFSFGYNGKLYNEDVEFSTFADLRDSTGYSKLSFGLSCDLDYDKEWSPFILFNYKSTKRGLIENSYMRDGVGLQWMINRKKEGFPGYIKPSFAIITERSSTYQETKGSFRIKHKIKLGDAYNNSVFWIVGDEQIFSLNGGYLIGWIPFVNDLNMTWNYDFEDIVDMKVKFNYKLSKHIDVFKEYRTLDGAQQESLGFEVNIK